MEKIYNVLNNYLKGSTKFGNNESIARFLLANLDRIPDMRLAEVAAECHTSTPSVIRFCREIGFEDYTDFKQKALYYRQEMAQEGIDPRTPIRVFGDDAEFESSLVDWTDRVDEIGIRAMLALDRAQLKRLIRDIVKYRYVYVFGLGLSGIVGEYLRIRLARAGKNIFSLTAPQYDVALAPDRADTLGILVTQQGRTLMRNPEQISYLNKNCDKTWMITQNTKLSMLPVTETIYLQGDPDSPSAEFQILLNLSELIGEGCQQLLERGNAE